jgi:hypothetical protein
MAAIADKIFQVLAVLHYLLDWRLIAVGQLPGIAVGFLPYYLGTVGLPREDKPGNDDGSCTRQTGGDPLDGHTPAQHLIFGGFSWLLALVFFGQVEPPFRQQSLTRGFFADSPIFAAQFPESSFVYRTKISIDLLRNQ